MKRFIYQYLKNWMKSERRKPLLLRGARQVGKTHAARKLGESFTHFVEVNFEYQPQLCQIFKKDLDPHRITKELSLATGQVIKPGSTLLFLDEIQEEPLILTSLRYFYENMPELHVIATGSLLDFVINSTGIPVGRVSSLYMYPLSFLEYLHATEYELLGKEIIAHPIDKEMPTNVHQKLLSLVGEYHAIGGMPEAVKCWKETKDPYAVFQVHHEIIDTYRQDFHKYSKEHQLKYVKLLFNQIPRIMGKKFMYKDIEGDYRKRELAPSFDLLDTARVLHKVVQSDANGLPIGAEANPHQFKVIFIDVGIAQSILGLNLKSWFLDPNREFVNKGYITEAFVGQEILAYSDPTMQTELYYWHRAAKNSQAEVDYLLQLEENLVPIEVKSGKGTSLKSLRYFLENKNKKNNRSSYGIRFSLHNFSIYNSIHSYPLYSIGKVLSPQFKNSLFTLKN